MRIESQPERGVVVLSEVDQVSLGMCFESRLEHVSLGGAAIRAMCVVRGANDQTAGAIELAAVEIATNVVLHAYRGRSDAPVRIRVRFLSDRIAVEISDTGESIPRERLTNAELPPIVPELPDDLPERGFGLALVRLLADTVDVRIENGWNVQCFTRRLRRADPS